MSSSPAPSGSYLTETSDALGGTGTGYALAPGAWFRGTLDSPLGLIHLKDLALTHGFNGRNTEFDLQAMLRPFKGQIGRPR